jgi:hypothetical protein
MMHCEDREKGGGRCVIVDVGGREWIVVVSLLTLHLRLEGVIFCNCSLPCELWLQPLCLLYGKAELQHQDTSYCEQYVLLLLVPMRPAAVAEVLKNEWEVGQDSEPHLL